METQAGVHGMATSEVRSGTEWNKMEHFFEIIHHADERANP